MKRSLTTSEFYAAGVAVFILDHIGLYFFTDNPWSRVLRLFAPAWFFPCGYNAGWKSRWPVWAGMGILIACDVLTGASALPLSALATIITARLLIVPVMDAAMKSRLHFIAVTGGLTVLLPAAGLVMEYGTFGLLFAMLGWLVKHRGQYDEKIVNAKYFAAFVTLLYLAHAEWVFGFSPLQFTVMALPVAGVVLLLWRFRDMVMAELKTSRDKGWRAKALRFIAHHSLAIYVAHLAAFRLHFAFTA